MHARRKTVKKLCSDLAPILFGLFLISKMVRKGTAVHDAEQRAALAAAQAV